MPIIDFVNLTGLQQLQQPGTSLISTNVWPVVLNNQIRGTIHSLDGLSSNILENIAGIRLDEGMLCYIKNGYIYNGYTRTGDSYYKYNTNGASRDIYSGAYPNDGSHWRLVTIAETGTPLANLFVSNTVTSANLLVTSFANIFTLNVSSLFGSGNNLTNVQTSGGSFSQPLANLVVSNTVTSTNISCNAFYTSPGPLWDDGTFINQSDSTAISPDGTWIAYGNSSTNQVYIYHNKTFASTLTIISPKFLAICNTGTTAVSNSTGISFGSTFISAPLCVPSLNSGGTILVYATSTDVYVYGGSTLHFGTPSNYQAIITPDGTKVIISNPPQSCANVYDITLSTSIPLSMPSSSYYTVSTNTNGSLISVSCPTDTRIFKKRQHAPSYLVVSSPLVLNTTSGSNTFYVTQTDPDATGITWTSNTNGTIGSLPLGTISTYSDSSIIYTIGQQVAIRSNTMNVVATNSIGSNIAQFIVSSNLQSNIYLANSSVTVMNTTYANSFSIIQDSNAYLINWSVTNPIPSLVSTTNTDKGILFSLNSNVSFLSQQFTVSAFTNPGGTVSKTFSMASNCTPIITYSGTNPLVLSPGGSFSLQTSNALLVSWSNTWNSLSTKGLFPGGAINVSSDTTITYNVDSSHFTMGTLNVYAQTSVGSSMYSLVFTAYGLQFTGYNGDAMTVYSGDFNSYINWFNTRGPSDITTQGTTQSLASLYNGTNHYYIDDSGGQTNFSVKWVGYYTPTIDGTYNFFSGSDDGSLLLLDGQVIVNNIYYQGYPGNHPNNSFTLTGGRKYAVSLYFSQGGGGYRIRVDVTPPGGSATDFGSVCTLN